MAEKINAKSQFCNYLILVALVAACGLFLTIRAVVIWRRGLRSLEWPQTNGVIRASRSYMNPEVQVHEVKYEYLVEGIKYSSKHKKIGIGGFMRESKKYRTGYNVPVYFDPDKPKMSVL